MARRTFFSFHYKSDVQRAQVVGQAWMTQDREEVGFFNSSAFEKAERTNPETLKAFLVAEMKGSSVVCVLVGSDTAFRRWVRFETFRGIWDERGLLAVRINGIAGWDRRTAVAGPNPFDLLGISVTENGGAKSVRFIERQTASAQWTFSSDFPKTLPKWRYGSIPAAGSHTLSSLFPIHDWNNNGYSQVGNWIETAAIKAGR